MIGACFFFLWRESEFCFFPKFAGPYTHGRPSCNVPPKFEGVLFHSFRLIIWVYTPMSPQPETSIDAWCFLLSSQIQAFVFFRTTVIQVMVDWWFGARWFAFLGFPYERDCYLGAGPNPSHQFTNLLSGMDLWPKFEQKSTCSQLDPGTRCPSRMQFSNQLSERKPPERNPNLHSSNFLEFFLRMEILTTQV